MIDRNKVINAEESLLEIHNWLLREQVAKQKQIEKAKTLQEVKDLCSQMIELIGLIEESDSVFKMIDMVKEEIDNDGKYHG